ncbi:MAG: hypothetical protein GY804_13995, partial [Alphaproteobacteria bacterium]|nr:hypothetical protein [Alphaproteobacteria bacterium]
MNVNEEDDIQKLLALTNQKKRGRTERKRYNTTSDLEDNRDREIDIEISPRNKKTRTSMLTFEELGEEARVVHDVDALNQLMSETLVYGMRKLLDCFSPTYESKVEMIKSLMLDTSGYGNDGISVYKQTIKFVTNDNTDINETDVGELAEILIAAIKNRMTKYCEDCCKRYVVERSDKPKKFCIICKVGQHDCLPESENNVEIKKGYKWFCNDCNEQFTNQNVKNKCRNIYFKGFEEDEIKILNKTTRDTIEKLRKMAKKEE